MSVTIHIGVSETPYFLAHNSSTIFHYGSVGVGQQIGTGQPNFELFGLEADLQARVEELGGIYEPEDEGPL